MSTSETTPKRRLRIVPVTDLQVGDIIKVSRRTVTKVDATGNIWPGGTAFYLKGSNTPHVHYNTRRLAVYR